MVANEFERHNPPANRLDSSSRSSIIITLSHAIGKLYGIVSTLTLCVPAPIYYIDMSIPVKQTHTLRFLGGVRVPALVRRLANPNIWRFRFPAAVALAVFWCLPYIGLPATLCPFHLLTGTACPLCGLSRSISALLQLDWWLSITLHPLGIVILILLIRCLFTNNPGNVGNSLRLPEPIRRTLFGAGSLAVLFLLVWIIRLCGLIGTI